MEYIRLAVRNAILTTETKLFQFRDQVTNVVSKVKDQVFKDNKEDNAKNLVEVNIKNESSIPLLEAEQNATTKSYCNFYPSNTIKSVSSKQQTACYSFNCCAIVFLKRIINCLINFICFPFVPCASIFFPNFCNGGTSSSSIYPCHPKPCCFCSRNQDNGVSKCCCSPVFCVILISFVFTLGILVFWIESSSSLFIIDVLLFFENLNQVESMLLFVVLFTVVSFPVMWGYVFLNLAAGYLYGFWLGLFVVVFSVSIGLTISHVVCKRYFSNCVMTLLKNHSNFDQVDAILQVIDGSSGLKVLALTRLTPIPFGLQNGLFSVTNVSLKYYLLASDAGLLPTQILNCYIASKFRSFDQVVDQENPKGYLLFFCQVILGIGLMIFVVQRARKELASALQTSGKTTQLDSGLEISSSATEPSESNYAKCTQPSSNNTPFKDGEMKQILDV